MPDSFGLEDHNSKHEMKNINLREMRDELFNRKLTDQYSLFKRKIDVDAKLVETILLFKDTEAFENYFEAIDKHNIVGSTIIQEADIFIKTDRKIFNQSKRSDYGKKDNVIDKKVVSYQGRNC